MYSKSFVKPIALLSLCVMFTIIAVLGLATNRDARESLMDAACTFDSLEPHCMDSNSIWTEGLAYYDSVLLQTRDTIFAVRSLLWDFWDLQLAGAEHVETPDVILPSRILEKKKTGCVGVTWLALMLKEIRGVQVQAFLVPGHIYFSVNDLNMEPNREGFTYSHDEYKKKYQAGSWESRAPSPIYRNQFLGIVAFNLGNAKLETDPKGALAWYRVASDFYPAYSKIGDNRRIALRKLSKERQR